MSDYSAIFAATFFGYARYLAQEVSNPRWGNYFYSLVAITAVVYLLELVRPFRVAQRPLREGFWLDLFYVFFNYFLFSLIGYAAVAEVSAAAFWDGLRAIGITRLEVVSLATLPFAGQLLVFFVYRDFVHYWIHRLLHRVPALWRVHEVHHSVREMGVAAHLRYHFGETIVYRSLELVPLALLGFSVTDLFVVHTLSLLIGHLNHANLSLPLGPLRYVFNSSRMHIFHHAKTLPVPYGVNYGLSLSVWDYLFRTAYWPRESPNEPLGFDGVERYPRSFFGQLAAPFRRVSAASRGRPQARP